MGLSTVELTSFTNGSTGDATIELNGDETPTLIDFWVGPRTATTETADLGSTGTVDIANGNATYQSNFSDTTGAQTVGGSGTATGSSCLQHYARVSGTITKVIDIEFVSAAAGSFKINILTANSNYRIFGRVYG